MKALNIIFKRNKSHLLYFLISVIIICIGLVECKKEEEPSIKITNLQPIEQIFERDTLRIEYNTTGSGLDSVCFFIDDKSMETQIVPQNLFMYIPAGEGAFSVQLRLGAYYKAGIVKVTGIYYVNISNLYTPPLRFIITRSDGLLTFFVGDKLKITVDAIEGDLKEYSQIRMLLNNDDLGTKTSPPYTFISNEILTSDNTIYVELRDQNNRIHHVKQELTVSVNSPPQVSYNFNNYTQSANLATDSILTIFTGVDNTMLEHMDLYVDNQKTTSYLIDNSSSIIPINLGVLPVGAHSTYCIAYDDFGAPAKSDVLQFTIFGDILLEDDILDGEYSDREDMVFLYSKSKLYVVNPVREELIKVFDLPYSDATSIDFVPEEDNLYISFNQGKLFKLNCSSEIFTEIVLTDISEIQDMEIDSDHNIVMVSNKKLIFYNFSTGKRSSGGVNLDDGSTLAFDKLNKSVFSGGNPESTGGYIYRHNLFSDSLHYAKRANIGGFSDKIQIDPVNNEFMIIAGGYSTGRTSYDMNTFLPKVVYELLYAWCASYSTDGNLVFIEDDYNYNINIFDSKSYSLLRKIAFPIGEQNTIRQLIPNSDNTTLTIVRKNVFKPECRIVFVRLNK